MTNQTPIAIVHNTSTLSITFVEKPNDDQHPQLREAGGEAAGRPAGMR
jgi:hypothetical protein